MFIYLLIPISLAYYKEVIFIKTIHLNPYCSILSSNHIAYLFTKIEQQVPIQEVTLKQLINLLPCSEDEVLTILKKNELDLLLESGVLLTHHISTTEVDSVNRGWFLAQNNEELYDIIKKKTVLILGCGGLGSHSAWSMVALGVKKLILIDDDTVSKDNLNRQLLYDQKDIGKSKVDVLREKLLKINPTIEIIIYKKKVCNPETDLSPILKKHGPIDLTIKAVDTPYNHLKLFSDYFTKINMPYTSGGTLGNGFVLGPTFHPELKNNYKKEIDTAVPMERIQVKGTSLPMIMEKIAAEINIEALHLLTDKLHEVKFNDCLHFETIYSTSKFQIKEGISTLIMLCLGFFSSFIGLVVATTFIFFSKLQMQKKILISTLITGFIIKQFFLSINTLNLYTLSLLLLGGTLLLYTLPLSIYSLLTIQGGIKIDLCNRNDQDK